MLGLNRRNTAYTSDGTSVYLERKKHCLTGKGAPDNPPSKKGPPEVLEIHYLREKGLQVSFVEWRPKIWVAQNSLAKYFP